MKIKYTFSIGLLFLFILPVFGDNLSCGLYEIPVNQRFTDASIVFEGKVLEQSCFWNAEKNLIYTSHLIKVYKIFKGGYAKNELIINTQGGSLDGQIHRISPNLDLSEGQTGIFFANGAGVANPSLPQNLLQLEAFAGPQGFIKYDLFAQTGTDPFNTYPSIEDYLYPMLKSKKDGTYIEMSPFSPKQQQVMKASVAPIISSFTPSSITAGTSSILTINGSGFGPSASGSATVMFKNADDGGNSFISALSSQIVSWSDNQIQVKVPHKAGTGNIRLVDASNNAVISANPLTVNYNVINLQQNGIAFRPILSDDSGNGGFVFQYATSFFNTNQALTVFQKALDTWRCASFVNFSSGNQNGAVSCVAQDGINVVSFDDAGGCSLPPGYLGQTFNYYSGCNSGANVYVSANEIDFKFSKAPGSGWNYGPSATTGGRFDFQSTAVHELGHAGQIDHIIAAGKVMHYALTSNSDVRTLNANSDIAAGNDVMGLSTVNNPCGPSPMKALNSGNCATITVDLNEEVQKEALIIFPQPSSGVFNFQFTGESSVSITKTVLLYNVMGEIILQKEMTSKSTEINLQNQAEGVYLYRILQTGKEMQKGKLYLVR